MFFYVAFSYGSVTFWVTPNLASCV